VGKRNNLSINATGSWVHPHGRGEKPVATGAAAFASGSPPRAWGKVRCPRDSRGVDGFTPTGVGKSPREKVKYFSEMVHPHGRGEKARPPSPSLPLPGSPPRAWGKVGARALVEPARRFTPTGVGKRSSKISWTSRARVHPHGRGEKSLPLPSLFPSPGSPPRAWGKDQVYRMPATTRRFTPTGVGKRGFRPGISPGNPVHPHGRGEKCGSAPSQRPRLGSPPRAWGKALDFNDGLLSLGFTPTGVGKRSPQPQRLARKQVHPHGRGEKSASEQKLVSPYGSPPRAWGKVAARHARGQRGRFTPTGVGKRRSANRGRAESKVHPHGRGEKGGL